LALDAGFDRTALIPDPNRRRAASQYSWSRVSRHKKCWSRALPQQCSVLSSYLLGIVRRSFLRQSDSRECAQA